MAYHLKEDEQDTLVVTLHMHRLQRIRVEQPGESIPVLPKYAYYYHEGQWWVVELAEQVRAYAARFGSEHAERSEPKSRVVKKRKVVRRVSKRRIAKRG